MKMEIGIGMGWARKGNGDQEGMEMEMGMRWDGMGWDGMGMRMRKRRVWGLDGEVVGGGDKEGIGMVMEWGRDEDGDRDENGMWKKWK